MECKNGMDLLYKAYYAIIGGIIAVDEKVWVLLAFLFVFCLFFVTLLNYEACDKGNAIKQCSFQNNNGAIVQNKFSVHLYSSFFMDHRILHWGIFQLFFCEPPWFFVGGKSFYTKIPFFGDFVGRKPTKVNFCVTVWTWDSFRRARYNKNLAIANRSHTSVALTIRRWYQ